MDTRAVIMNEMINEGKTFREVGAKFGLSKQRVHQILDEAGFRKPVEYCINCGKPLEGRRHKKYCSEKCTSEWLYKYGGTVQEIRCKICGKTFINRGAHIKKYCSRKCYFAHTRKYNVETAREMAELMAQGQSTQKIAKLYHTLPMNVWRWVKMYNRRMVNGNRKNGVAKQGNGN